jgi:hypothetical protein
MSGDVGREKHEISAGLVAGGVLAPDFAFPLREIVLPPKTVTAVSFFSFLLPSVLSFTLSYHPRTDDPDLLAMVGMGNNQQAAHS